MLTALPLSVDQVVAALPPKGVAASIPPTEVVEEGVAAALLDPSLARLPPDDVDGPLPRARLHVCPGELTRLLNALVERGLAEPVEDSTVWTHEGREALAGLFGVEKKGETLSPEDPRPKLRLIINLVHSNTLQRVIPGDIAQLPTTGQWNSVHLLQHEVMLLSSSDRR